MIALVQELFPKIKEERIVCHTFGEHLENLLPEEGVGQPETVREVQS